MLFFIIISIFKQSPPRHSSIGISSVEHSSAGHSLKRALWQMDTSVVAQPYVRHSGSRTLPQQYTISYRRVQIRTLQSMLEFPVSEVQLSDYKWLKSTFLNKKNLSEHIFNRYIHPITYFGVRLNSLSRQTISDIGFFILL